MTLAWNVLGVAVLFVLAYRARSVALVGFGVDSLVEIGASTVVLWELRDVAGARRAHGLRLIGIAFVLLATYLGIQSVIVIARGFHPHHSPLGMVWTLLTAGVMWALARRKRTVGLALANSVLITEARVTMVDAVLAAAVLIGLTLNVALGWWWADPGAAMIIVGYALREGLEAIRHASTLRRKIH
ncbi:MAG: cation transporter [Acidimicrobiaceae bacterium]|nr:cation transporter [Acidimicrobiaceae bacterium]